jgi:hypothetical protein
MTEGRRDGETEGKPAGKYPYLSVSPSLRPSVISVSPSTSPSPPPANSYTLGTGRPKSFPSDLTMPA